MKLTRPMTVAAPGSSFARAGATASYFDITGAKQIAPADLPRWDYDPSDLTRPPRLLIEKAATNLLLNSAALATQSLAVTAQAYTLSFYGTGTVTLSGVATAVVTGSSAAVMTTLTFTPTAGSLTLTVTGSVIYANLETGAAASSWIPTTGAAATRNADTLPSFLTTLQETVPAAYAGGTTYALGALVSVSIGGTAYDVYRALAGANTGHTPASSPTWWQKVNTVYAAWDVATTYTTGDVVTSGHVLFKSAAGGAGHALPPGKTSNADWAYVGATMPWKAFDLVVQDQAQALSHIGFCILGAGYVDALAGFNTSAGQVRVMQYDPTDGYVFDQTVSMNQTAGDSGLYSYFFEPIRRMSDWALDGLYPYFNAYIVISFSDTGSTVGIGEMPLGQQFEIGDTQYGAQVGFQDYSIKQVDPQGNWTILERAYSKKFNGEIWCDESESDAVMQTMAGYRATPIVYRGADQYNATLVYGFSKDCQLGYTYFKKHVLSLQIEGLT